MTILQTSLHSLEVCLNELVGRAFNSDALSSAAVAFVDAINEKHSEKPDISEKATCSPALTVTNISPGRAVDNRMKNYQQLRYLQSLFDDGILTDSEYAEQKQSILSSLHKL